MQQAVACLAGLALPVGRGQSQSGGGSRWWDQSGYTAEANLIIRNSASGNTFDYDMATTDYFGGILNTNNITGGTDGFIDTNPWSNFTF